jgi:hypothetical protein
METHEFQWDLKSEVLEVLIVEYKYKPSIAQIKKDFLIVKNRYKEGSIYNLFNPKICISYYFIYGWVSGYNVYFTTDEKSRYIDRPFFDEPTGKYTKPRKIIEF